MTSMGDREQQIVDGKKIKMNNTIQMRVATAKY